MKRNKIRYQSKPVKKIPLVLSGRIYLRYQDEDAIAAAQKGDLLVYPRCESLNLMRQGDYENKGFSGYFKVDIHDGNEWKLVLIHEIFKNGEHHFSKTEYPIDTYKVCRDILQSMTGKSLIRTYREHYEPDPDEETP